MCIIGRLLPLKLTGLEYRALNKSSLTKKDSGAHCQYAPHESNKTLRINREEFKPIQLFQEYTGESDPVVNKELQPAFDQLAITASSSGHDRGASDFIT